MSYVGVSPTTKIESSEGETEGNLACPKEVVYLGSTAAITMSALPCLPSPILLTVHSP